MYISLNWKIDCWLSPSLFFFRTEECYCIEAYIKENFTIDCIALTSNNEKSPCLYFSHKTHDTFDQNYRYCSLLSSSSIVSSMWISNNYDVVVADDVKENNHWKVEQRSQVQRQWFWKVKVRVKRLQTTLELQVMPRKILKPRRTTFHQHQRLQKSQQQTHPQPQKQQPQLLLNNRSSINCFNDNFKQVSFCSCDSRSVTTHLEINYWNTLFVSLPNAVLCFSEQTQTENLRLLPPLQLETSADHSRTLVSFDIVPWSDFVSDQSFSIWCRRSEIFFR